MEILIKIVQFFLCFTLLVGLHELGHFLMARIFKIRVEKFYIFFDPWFSLFRRKIGDTEYGIGWLPMGGYVKIAGMIDESMDTEQMKQPAKPDEFRAKPAWQRFLVMVAGVIMNILLALVIYSGICYAWGDNYFSNLDARWGYNFNEKGHELGFEDGDRILTIDGEEIDNVARIPSLLLITDKDREVTVERNGERRTLTLRLDDLIDLRQSGSMEDFQTLVHPFFIDSIVRPEAAEAGLRKGDRIVALNGERLIDFTAYTPRLEQMKSDTVRLTVERGITEQELAVPLDTAGRIGVLTVDPSRLYTPRTRHYTLAESIPAGVKRCGRVIASYWEQLKLIVQPRTQMYKELGGFIAIGSIFPSEWNWLQFWLNTAFLSIILAVMNILPIPGLDGGHALFTLWEMLTGRKLSDKFLEAVQYVGLIIIIGLILYANGNDFYRFIFKRFF